jgi:hypothetical protein
MAIENNIKVELLKQMDTNSSASGDEIRRSIIMKNTARVRRLKWLTIIIWILVVICFAVGAIIECNVRGIENDTLYKDTLLIAISSIIFQAILLIAIVLTVSFFIRSRSLTLQQIQNRLANIEEQLKRMSSDE